MMMNPCVLVHSVASYQVAMSFYCECIQYSRQMTVGRRSVSNRENKPWTPAFCELFANSPTFDVIKIFAGGGESKRRHYIPRLLITASRSQSPKVAPTVPRRTLYRTLLIFKSQPALFSLLIERPATVDHQPPKCLS